MAKFYIINEPEADKLWLVDLERRTVESLDRDLIGSTGSAGSDFLKAMGSAKVVTSDSLRSEPSEQAYSFDNRTDPSQRAYSFDSRSDPSERAYSFDSRSDPSDRAYSFDKRSDPSERAYSASPAALN